MFGRAVLTVVAVAGLALAPANAADLPVKTPLYKAPPPVVAVFSWTGFYVGGFVGDIWTSTTSSAFDAARVQATYGRVPAPRGAFGGLDLGYNWQMPNNVVIGVEVELDGLGLAAISDTAGIPGFSTVAARVNWAVNVGAKLGYAFNRALPYVMVGPTWAHTNVAGANPFIGAFTLSNTHAGWFVAAGLEYALIDNWTVRAQYRYAEYEKRPYNAVSLGAHASAIMLGVNYRFGGPVVAKF